MSVTMYSECDCGARTPDAHLGDCRVGKLEAELAKRDALLREVQLHRRNLWTCSSPEYWLERRDELLGEQE